VHGEKYAGGITGYAYNTKINKSYSRATLVAADYCGGIAGMLEKNTEVKQNIAINNSISVETGIHIGRTIASWNTSAEYYNTIGAIGTNETNKALNTTKVVICGIQKTDIEDDIQNGQSAGNTVLKYKATYQGIGWDFTDTWDMQETESFPYFQWQAAPPIINSAKSGETTVTGKGTDGATIEVTIGDTTYQTTCSGNNWSITVAPLVAGSTIYARAKTSDKEPSYRVSQQVAYLGAGTEADPYKIYTAEELANINGDGNYKVMNDIDLSTFGTWTPIGQYEAVTANLNGDNHTISGLSINTTDDYQGLFAQCDGSEIKNIKLTISTLTGGNYTGALVSKIVGGEITNCSITGNVSGGEYTGGLVGYSQDTKIGECSFKGNVVGATFVGGLAAFASGEVSLSQYQGEVSSTTSSAVVGGLIGNNNANISECRSQGKATCTASNSMVGGLVGTNNDTIINCYSESEITANQYAGGLVGYNYGFVQSCYAKGNITSTNVAGGLVGYNDGTKAIVKNCSAMNPSINATSSTGIAIRVIGGLKNSAPTPEMNNYALKTMAVSVNGVAQTIYDDNLHGVSKTDAVLKQGATYSGIGWNMSSVWGVKEGTSYPYLYVFNIPVITVKGEHGTVTGGGSYKVGTFVTLTATPNEHYTFAKWSDGNTQSTRTIVVTGDATYTAEFKADQFTITASATNGSITGAGTYDYGTQATLTIVPNAHYHLVQWSDGLTTLSRTLTVTKDSTLSAECAIDQYTITVEGQNGTVTGGGTYTYGEEVTLTATPNEHYHFVNWSDGVTTSTRTITVSANATYTAEFAIDQYTITTSATNGSVTGAGTYDYGKQVTLTATANAHYHFVRWSDGVTTPTRTITVSANATYTAEFAVDQYSITTKVNNAAMGSVTGAGTYDYNAQIALYAVPEYGYEFSKWSDNNTDNPRSVTVTKNAQYMAVFVASTFAVTALSADDAMGSVTGGGDYSYNTSAIITAVPEKGFEFVMWDDGNTDNPRTILVTEEVIFMATFQPTSTALDDVKTNDQGGATKFIHDGILYILRDGKVYNAQGLSIGEGDR